MSVLASLMSDGTSTTQSLLGPLSTPTSVVSREWTGGALFVCVVSFTGLSTFNSGPIILEVVALFGETLRPCFLYFLCHDFGDLLEAPPLLLGCFCVSGLGSLLFLSRSTTPPGRHHSDSSGLALLGDV